MYWQSTIGKKTLWVLALCCWVTCGIWYITMPRFSPRTSGITTVAIKNQFNVNPCNRKGGDDTFQNYTLASAKCIKALNRNSTILTQEHGGRLGNQMFSYAALYAISVYNGYTGYISPVTSEHISKYFTVSLDTMDWDLFYSMEWETRYLTGNVPEDIKSIPARSKIKFTGYAQTWKYFHELRHKILEEFRFLPTLEHHAQVQLKTALRNFYPGCLRKEVTFIGIHVRRTDYLTEYKTAKFIVPSVQFFQSAMEYMSGKYKNVIYILASDDIGWCVKHFAHLTQEYFMYFLEGSQEDGGRDLAVFASCDHIIFGLGTFGFWAAYLVEGEVVHCADCITKESGWLIDSYAGDYANFILPTWTGMSWNVSLRKSY